MDEFKTIQAQAGNILVQARGIQAQAGISWAQVKNICVLIEAIEAQAGTIHAQIGGDLRPVKNELSADRNHPRSGGNQLSEIGCDPGAGWNHRR